MNSPGEHTVQPSAGATPPLHVHAVETELPTGESEFDGQFTHTVAPGAAEYVFAAQSVHGADPVDDLYVPATHCSQSLSLFLKYPALHRHAARDVLVIAEYEFAGHGRQVDACHAPVVVEYLPLLHIEQ